MWYNIKHWQSPHITSENIVDIQACFGIGAAFLKPTAEAAFGSRWDASVKSCPKFELTFQKFFDKLLLPDRLGLLAKSK